MSTGSAPQGLAPFSDHDTVSLTLTWNEAGLPSFYPLLQHGVLVKANLGVNVREVLCGQLGVSSEYLDGRIKTVFLDGKPVDDVDAAVVPKGASLGLSAALPGFVGAALRKGGFYSRMRQEITHSGQAGVLEAGEGYFVLKLYNLVLNELGPLFLAAGFWTSADDLKRFFSERPDRFWAGCRNVEIDGRQAQPHSVRDQTWSNGRRVVFLTVKTSSEQSML
jgi:hypothetical protein